MAISNDLKVGALNFEGIKSNFVNYLRAQDQFRDYNFDGSGMQVLLDVLAYNTYYNAFYLNMIANENFLATAQKRNSVVAIARSLNYLPRSITSATITGSFLVATTGGAPATITIPAYTTFTGTIDSISYTFNTTESISITASDGVYATDNITLKEGTYLRQSYTVNKLDSQQRFLIPNANADTGTMTVTIQNSAGDTTQRVFTKPDNLIEVTSTSEVYFLEEVEDGLYEIFFGDGVLGVGLDDANIVIIDYLVSNGKEANDIQDLVFSGSVDNVTDITFTQDDPAAGGADRESVNKIKFSAPKAYEAQNRVVTAEDYKALLLKQSNIQSVVVWGGEDNNPPAYGKVYIAVKPINGEVLTATEKTNLINTVIKPKKVLTVSSEIVDPEYIYITVETTVKYDVNRAVVSSTSLEQKVIDTIKQYNDDDINEFSKYFRYSKLTRLIDASDRSILNSLTTVKMVKEVDIQLGQSTRYEINFSNAFNDSSDGRSTTQAFAQGNQITSNQFTYSGYSQCFFDDNNGVMRIYRLSGSDKIAVVLNAGTVDYDAGTIILTNFAPTAFADGSVTLKLTANPRNLDILPLRNQIVSIRDADINVTIVDDNSISLVNR